MYKLLYYIVYIWMYLHALLPFSVLYFLSDIFYFFVYKLAGYRLKIVRLNLKNAFPDKTEKELLHLERDFYHNFCDYFLETIKLFHISDEEMLKRMQFINMDIVKDYASQGYSVLMCLGHYGNWEWVPSITLHLKDTEMKTFQIYRPLKNKAFDELFLKIRSRFGSSGITKNDTLRSIIRLKNEGIQTLIGFMSDQSPSINNIHYWTTFLNQETPVYTGVERIAKKTDSIVTYLDVQKIKRGYYTATVKIISDKPKEEPENSITEKYIRAMEKTILRNPAYWLWTHKRWKWQREEVERIHALRHNK